LDGQRIRALEAKRSAYRTEVALLQLSANEAASLPGVPSDGRVAEDALGAEAVVRDAVQLEETLAALRCELRERRAVLQDAEQSQTELAAVYEALVAKVNSMHDYADHRQAVDVSEGVALAWAERIEMRRRQLARTAKELQQMLALFISKGYPPVDKPDPVTGLPRTHSLRVLVNKLIEAYLNGESPWVSMEHAWAPYVELLLRSNVAELHEHDKGWMRLVDFLAEE
jgi:hypothetical protein